MLRSSAGNFYNYFRPGAGELIRSAEPRRRFPPSRPLPVAFPPSLAPSRHRSPFFFLFYLYLRHHLASLTTHGPSSSTRSVSSRHSSFFPFCLVPAAPTARIHFCVPRYCSKSGVVRSRGLCRNIDVAYLPRSFAVSGATTIVVPHLLEIRSN